MYINHETQGIRIIAIISHGRWLCRRMKILFQSFGKYSPLTWSEGDVGAATGIPFGSIPFAFELSFSRPDTFHTVKSARTRGQSFLRLVKSRILSLPRRMQPRSSQKRQTVTAWDRKMEAEGVGKSFVKPLSERSGRARTPVTADH